MFSLKVKTLLIRHFSKLSREVTNNTMSTDIDTDALQDIKGMTPEIMKILIEEGFTSSCEYQLGSRA